MRRLLQYALVALAGLAVAGTVSVRVSPQLARTVAQGPGRLEMDVQPDQAALLVDGQPVPAVIGEVVTEGHHSPRSGWPVAEETGLLVTPGPTEPALRFTTAYLSAPVAVGHGTQWTLTCWVRPDNPDWGTRFQRDPRVPPVLMRPILVSLDDATAARWRLRLNGMRPEIEIGDWRATGTARLPVGRWTHLAVVRDGGTVRLYVDGKADRLVSTVKEDAAPGPVPAPPARAADVPPPTLRLAGSPAGQPSKSAVFGESFIGALGSLSLEDRAGDAMALRAQAAAGRAAADRLAQRYSVLDDPQLGARSRHILRQSETSAAFLARTAWWRQGKFGLFLHWGPSTLTKKEISWSRGTGEKQTPPEVYDALYKQFNPVNYDPDAWAAQLKAAGMRYAVLTTKHHDGFCEWPTQTTAYHIGNSPYGKDVVGPYATAMRNAGVKVGFYFSGPDWWYEDTTTKAKGRDRMLKTRQDYIQAQVRELCTQYGAVDLLWFDGWGALFDGMEKAQPGMLINDRGGPGDYTTPENYLLDHPILNPNGSDAPWETCSGSGGYWGYASEQPHLTAAATTRYLVEVVAKGGNWLLNVAPRETGELPQTHMAMLAQVGDWLKVNGASIYGTHRTHLGAQPWGWTTANDTTLFLHVLRWPGTKLTVPDLYDRVTAVSLLAGGGKLPFIQQGDTLTVTLPTTAPDPVDTVIAVRIERRAPRVAISKGRFINRTEGGETLASGGHPPAQTATQAFDDRLDTKWFEPAKSTGWLQVRFANDAAWAVTRYSLTSGGDVPERDPKDWHLQGSQDGATWTTVDSRTEQTFPGRTATLAYDFDNTTAYRYYRLLVTANRDAGGMQLTEVRLYTYAGPEAK